MVRNLPINQKSTKNQTTFQIDNEFNNNGTLFSTAKLSPVLKGFADKKNKTKHSCAMRRLIETFITFLKTNFKACAMQWLITR